MSAAPLLVAVHPDWYPDSAACSLEKFHRRKECMPGFGPEVIDFLLDYLNIPYKIVELSSNKTSGQRLISKTEKGSWSGVLGDIERGVYDTVAAPYIRTSDRLDSFTLTVPVNYFEAVFVVGPTQPNVWDSTLKLVTIFDPVLFGTALGTLVVILLGCLATVMIFSDKQKASEPLKRKHHGGLLYAPEHRTAGGKAIVLIFWFTVILFSELYEGCLLSSLLVTQDNNIRMTETQLFDRVYQKKLTFIADKSEFENYGLWQSMRFDNSSKYETFQKSLIRNPPILVDSSEMKPTVNSLFEQDPD
uniref:Uncharacterized protein n=1 Tax=Plectus sambesii TaxID=2011161 RepID=A0A914XE57_9BILA